MYQFNKLLLELYFSSTQMWIGKTQSNISENPRKDLILKKTHVSWKYITIYPKIIMPDPKISPKTLKNSLPNGKMPVSQWRQ